MKKASKVEQCLKKVRHTKNVVGMHTIKALLPLVNICLCKEKVVCTCTDENEK